MNKQREHVRCVQCGEIGQPRLVPGKPIWVVLGLWALSTVVWAVGFILGIQSVLYLGIVLLLPALLYTLWYFNQREAACRHCGSRQVEPGASP